MAHSLIEIVARTNSFLPNLLTIPGNRRCITGMTIGGAAPTAARHGHVGFGQLHRRARRGIVDDLHGDWHGAAAAAGGGIGTGQGEKRGHGTDDPWRFHLVF